MKIDRRNLLVASASAGLLATADLPASAQNRSAAAPGKVSVAGRQVAVYTTAEKSDYRLSATDALNFKHLGQPLETQVCVFVDPSKAYQTMIGFGGAITDSSAETLAKIPEDKQREFLD